MTFVHPTRSRPAAASQSPYGGIGFGIVPKAFAVLDWITIVILTTAASLAYDLAKLGYTDAGDHYLKLGATTATLFLISALARGIYARSHLDRLAVQVKEIALNWGVVSALLLIIAPAVGVANVPSPHVLLSVIAGLCGVSLTRWAERQAILLFPHPILGAKRQAVVIQQMTQRNPTGLPQLIDASGVDVCKTFELPTSDKEAELMECMNEVIRYVRQHPIEEILLAASWADTQLIEKIADRLEVLPLPVTLLPDPAISGLLARPVVRFGQMGAVELQRAPLTKGQRGAKRVFDLTVTIGLLLLLLPVLVVVAALIFVDSRGPIFFRQRRIGFNASIFQIYKFRTMTVLEDGEVIYQAQRNDVRITRVGRFLRRFSIDELPQLLNVLKGDMSLVGPRPHALAHDEEYNQLITFYPARHKVKPGITGWAQVNGLRGATPYVHAMMMRVEYDVWYVDRWSLWLDIKILLLTSLCIWTSRNAH